LKEVQNETGQLDTKGRRECRLEMWYKQRLGRGESELSWLGDVRHATDDSILTLVDHLPAEAAERADDPRRALKPDASAVRLIHVMIASIG